MLGQKYITVLVICAVLFGCAGAIYAVADTNSFIGPVLIIISIAMTVVVTKVIKNKGLETVTRHCRIGVRYISNIGDGLLLVGTLLGLVAMNLFSLPTKEDRMVALAGPALIFCAGIAVKIYCYLNPGSK